MGLLAECPTPRDALPYTDMFAGLKQRFETELPVKYSDVDFWRALSSIGKGGGLAGIGGRKRAPRTPRITEEEQLEILRLLPDGIGNRDHLPYTPEFDEMHRRFGKLTGTKLAKHDFWRAVSRVAKRSRKPKPLFDMAPLGGLSVELVQFLERANPWWKAQPTKETKRFKRWAFAEVMTRLKAAIAPVVVIRGPRRVGKTTIQEQVIEHLLLIERVEPRRILRVQFDDIPGLGVLANPVEAIIRWYEENILGETLNAAAKRNLTAHLFFDELQNLPKWSEQLKSLVDHVQARTFVTGSSALRIAKGSDSLAGRMTPIELGPLRLGEIAGLRGLRELPQFAPNSALEDWKKPDFWLKLGAHGRKYATLRDEAFTYFSDFGGYPLCHVTPLKDVGALRQQIVGEVVTKTIDFDSMHRPHASAMDQNLVREVFRIVCRYAGQSVRAKAIAEQISQVLQSGVTNAKVDDVLQFLADSLLIQRIAPLEMLLKKQPNAPKLCLCDHFVRNGVLQETVPIAPAALASVEPALRTVAGHLIESTIGYFLKGIPGLDVSWWPAKPDDPEVDFVIIIGEQRIPIEVKYRRGEPTKDDTAGIESFCGKPHYNAPFGLLITQSIEGQLSPSVIALPASSFLLVR